MKSYQLSQAEKLYNTRRQLNAFRLDLLDRKNARFAYPREPGGYLVSGYFGMRKIQLPTVAIIAALDQEIKKLTEELRELGVED